MSLSIATWNVNGIRARQTEVQAFIDLQRPDVLCLQELKAAPDQLPIWLADLEGYWCCWHGEKGYSGVGLLVRKERFPDRPAIAHPPFDFEHRIATATLPGLTVASVYVPNGGKNFDAKIRFLEALEQLAGEHEAQALPLVLCGDLNVTRTDMDVHPKERKPHAVGQLPQERALLEEILQRGLVDVHRQVLPDNSDVFTWWAPWRNMKARNIGWRIDYVLASGDLARGVRSCTVMREVGTSDHGPLVAIFDT